MNVPTKFSAGSFQLSCWGGYPYLVNITYGDADKAQKIDRVRHTDLKDLEHCLSRMVAVIRKELGEDAAEMG